MKHEDFVTHIKNGEDHVYLKTKHFPVNMRLFKTSPQYKAIIKSMCNYIKFCLTEKEGYKKPHGMSSANIGMSFNIIGITMNRNTNKEYYKVMINPEIIKKLGSKITAYSNCGSLTLDEPIEVTRNSDILVGYFDEDGEYHEEHFSRKNGSLTIQHEIDHNLGILITDRAIS